MWIDKRHEDYAHHVFQIPQDIIQAIDLRNSRFQTNTRQTILDKTRGKVVLDHLMLDDVSGQPYVTDDAVTGKAEVLRYFTDVWHAPRNCEPLQAHPFWADADVWDGLMMVPRTGEVNSAISSAPFHNSGPLPSPCSAF
ncbi:hypothetical protein BG006_002975 [Podila minutissima]|uniref:Uncharacterized protein n=1 Tax=Podila minutissima TaxID=64525 RepID=A0A9P5S8R8_9FUNG|nr:hypothetical protein BG006_002975 [Podila minutissima]